MPEPDGSKCLSNSGELTVEELRKAKWQPQMFLDLAKGGFSQQYKCVEYPGIYFGKGGETRRGPFWKKFDVHGVECATIEEAVAAFNAPSRASDRPAESASAP